ncbi:MAG: hypothetical protein LUG91_04175 [Ruminococcus sp.]|nr:hypothetical protein [Ruminococcus sp.]
MIHSKTLLISLLISYSIIIADVIAWYKLYREGIDVDTSIFYKWLGVNRGMNAGIYFFMALPLLNAFAYSWSISYDRSSGYIIQAVTRCSRKKYFTAKYLVTFISGGIVFSSSLILDYLLLSLFSPAYRPVPGDLASSMDPFRFCSDIFYQNTYLFVLIWIGVAFLWGGAMSSMGLAAGMFIRKHIITSMVPFLVFLSELILSIYISRKYLITISGYSVNLGWIDMLYAAPASTSLPEHIFFSIFLIIIISTFIYVLRGRKYECL